MIQHIRASRPSRVAGLGIIALLAVGTTADAQTNTKVLNFSKSGAWSIQYVMNGTNFSHCSAGAKYKSGTRVGIVALANGTWRLSFYHHDWPERTGQKFDARLVVDGREVLKSTGQFNRKSALIDLGRSAEHVQALMKGKVMSVETPSGNSAFKLDGSREATKEAARCWTAQMRGGGSGGGTGGAFGAPNQGGAFGSAPPANGAFGGNSTASTSAGKLSRSETLELATRYLGSSSVPYEILPTERNVMKHFPINWRYQTGSLGGMMAVKGSARTSDQVLSSLLGEQASFCKGSSANNRDPQSTREGSTLWRGTSLCSVNGKLYRTTFSIWNAPGNLMLIVIESGAQGGSQSPMPNQPNRLPSNSRPKPNEI